MQVQVLFPAPSALTIGAASELIRNDELAFLYAKPGPLPPLSPVFRRNTRLGLQHGPGSFVNLSDQPRRDFNSRGFFRICRVPRVRRVIRVIRVIRVRIRIAVEQLEDKFLSTNSPFALGWSYSNIEKSFRCNNGQLPQSINLLLHWIRSRDIIHLEWKTA